MRVQPTSRNRRGDMRSTRARNRRNPPPVEKGGLRWAIWASCGIVSLSCVPYLIAYAIAPPGYKFIGLGANVDDASVYLSWMRQAADGHFFIRNLFTTEPQVAHGFNFLFFVLGVFARLTHLPLIAVFHLARIASGLGLLLAVYGFAGIWLKDLRSKRIALLVVGLSAGFGWLYFVPKTIIQPVDNWQHEAFTFLSIYLSPLLVFPMLMMLGALYFLLRFTETGRWKHAAYAGVILLFLSNIHGYDVITVGITWAFYAIYELARRRNLRPVVGGLAAALIAAPAAAYQVHFYLTEAVFRERVGVGTYTMAFGWYIVGYGLLLPLAAFGAWKAYKSRTDVGLLVCWVVAAFVGAYLPVSFQRKLISGTHIPLSLLATIGIVGLVKLLPSRFRTVSTAALIVLMMPSSFAFMARDIARIAGNESNTTAHVPFISKGELAALDYLRKNTGPNDVILSPCGLAVLIPGYTGRCVYYGHWGETVRFSDKLFEAAALYMPRTPDVSRYLFLRSRGITYVVGYHFASDLSVDMVDFGRQPLPFLIPVFDSKDVGVYRVANGTP